MKCGRSFTMGKLSFALIVGVVAVASGCMPVPARYRQPLQIYQPLVQQLNVTGLDTPMMRRFLEETHCARRVGVAFDDFARRVEVTSFGEGDDGVVEWAAAIVEACTLLPLVGLPSPGKVKGGAEARLYVEGEFVGTQVSSTRLRYWTTMYSAASDQERAVNAVRSMALRALADQVAAELCQGSRASAK
jgi:hypothetical protein